MNLTEHVVTEVKSKPYQVAGISALWCVDVLADSWGSVQPATAHVATEEEAWKVRAGYRFEA